MSHPARPAHPDRRTTTLERRLIAWADRTLDGASRGPVSRVAVEFAVFVVKQAWACLFGALMLACLIAARLWYPDDAPLARPDALVIAAAGIQVVMLAFRLESGREFLVILLFHVVGTVMELFKTDVGSWAYETDGVLRLGGVPLYTGFMYAAVGSYLTRVMRLHDLRFTRYPPVWATAVVAALIYVNFFTHHWFWDARWVLTALVVALYLRTWMHVRVHRATFRMPVLASFAGVAVFLWIAENLGTWAGAWLYPSQTEEWHPVSFAKFGAWFLLMLVSVVLVTLVHPPRRPDS